MFSITITRDSGFAPSEIKTLNYETYQKMFQSLESYVQTYGLVLSTDSEVYISKETNWSKKPVITLIYTLVL